MFCAPGLVFGGTGSGGSLFHILRSRIHFRRYRVRPVSFSCFPRPDSFSTVPRASVPVFNFCAPGLFFGDTEGVGSRFHILRARTRQVPFFMFCVPRHCVGSCLHFCAPELVFGGTEGVGSRFMFCAPELIFGGAEGVESRYHVLHSKTRFRRCGACRVPF
jgi:hypothetical protein